MALEERLQSLLIASVAYFMMLHNMASFKNPSEFLGISRNREGGAGVVKGGILARAGNPNSFDQFRLRSKTEKAVQGEKGSKSLTFLH